MNHKPLFQALPQFVTLKNSRWLQRRITIWLEDSSDHKLPQEDKYQESVRLAFSDDTSALALIRLPKSE